ncbi:MAG: MotA/TolQ/ExbB proton channel family protein, partial [Alphaproteobacteria bacterium]
GTPGAINPETGLPADQGAAPANEAAPAGAIEESKPEAPAENPYGLAHMFNLKNPDPVTFAVGIILAIMSGGSWLLFITKYMSSGALLSQAKSATRGGEPRGAFRSLAEDAQAAAAQHSQISGQVALSDWVATALSRSIDNISSQLRGGNAFLATVASSAPFVGLFGTVYGILKALLAIGIAGQPSIDKVAGPVGEALIMTAIGLFAAVPAVIFYNVIIGRNRQVTDALRNYASDLQAQALGASAGGSGRRR